MSIIIEDKILELRNELKTDRLDMSFGEIMNIYDEYELIISPEYQRAFRWKLEQKTRFIESILLGIPIPPIFVAEDDNGKWELVDGLQRISTILSFFGKLKIDDESKSKKLNNFKLTNTELLGDTLLNISINDFTPKLKNTIKRAVCRVEILRWDSKLDMRYELFNRLNTGSSPLTQQEVRNCVFTGDFNNIIQNLAKNQSFIKIINPTDKQLEEMFLEELVLRFFAFKNKYNNLKIEMTIQDFLSHFMKDIVNNNLSIDIDEYKDSFSKVVSFLNNNFDYKIFRAKNGLFTPNVYDTIMYVLDRYFDKYVDNVDGFRSKLKELLKDDKYKEVSGASTYASQRMKLKIERAEEIFNVS